MRPSDLQKISDIMETSIAHNIEKYVNGHIREIKGILHNQDTVIAKIQQQMNNMKNDTDPLVNERKFVTWTGKAVIWIATSIIAILTAWKLIPWGK